MRESVRTALSWICSHTELLGLESGSSDSHLLKATNIHVHFPAAATPKDGPSAGVTVLAALVSLLTNRLARADTAMTGEVSLRGHVLPVGGVREKVHDTGCYPLKLREVAPSSDLSSRVTLGSYLASSRPG